MSVLSVWKADKGILHFTLIDPDKQEPKQAGMLAASAEEAGCDAIMVGGSTAGSEITDKCVREIKGKSGLPVILFPSTAGGVSPAADYLFFMMLMNSRNPRFLTGEQAKAAPHLEKMGVQPISMGYIVVSTSSEPTTVEKVGEVERIMPDETEKALGYALTAKYYGMSCIYLEAGSGAEKPVTTEMISLVKEKTGITLIVGGGIRTPVQAREAVQAGADIIVTGTIAEKDPEALKSIIRELKK